MKMLPANFIISIWSITTLIFLAKSLNYLIHEEYQFLAATPDGIIECECCGQGVLEIKCPYCIRDGEPDLANFLNDGSLPKSLQC